MEITDFFIAGDDIQYLITDQYGKAIKDAIILHGQHLGREFHLAIAAPVREHCRRRAVTTDTSIFQYEYPVGELEDLGDVVTDHQSIELEGLV